MDEMVSVDVGQMLQITWSGSSRSAVQGRQEEEPRGNGRGKGDRLGGKGGKSDLAGNNNSNP